MTVLGTFCEQITFDFNLAFSDFYEVCSTQGGLPRFFLKKRPLLPENAFFLKQGPLDSYIHCSENLSLIYGGKNLKIFQNIFG